MSPVFKELAVSVQAAVVVVVVVVVVVSVVQAEVT